VTGNPEVISSPVGLVPRNALVLTEPSYSRMVDKPEVGQKRGSRKSGYEQHEIASRFLQADFWTFTQPFQCTSREG
jgi:hypothetical protein